MISRYYKIRKKDSDQFWSGYSSMFTKHGSDFRSLEDVGISLFSQMAIVDKPTSQIWDWVIDAEIVEYEVEWHNTGTFNATSIIKLTQLYKSIKHYHGDEFLKGYKSIISNSYTIDLYKYSVRIDKTQYIEFRQAIKDLGYSSRHFKKTGSWIWFDNDDLGFRIKLISGIIEFVDLSNYTSQYKQLYVKTVPLENEIPNTTELTI